MSARLWATCILLSRVLNAGFKHSAAEQLPTLTPLQSDRQGMALYLRVLEALLRAEEARTGRAAFPALLASASFHRCLLACAFELVVAAYCMVRPPPRP